MLRLLTTVMMVTMITMMMMQVITSVMFFHGTAKEDFDSRWKSRHLVKQFMEHKASPTSTRLSHVTVS